MNRKLRKNHRRPHLRLLDVVFPRPLSPPLSDNSPISFERNLAHAHSLLRRTKASPPSPRGFYADLSDKVSRKFPRPFLFPILPPLSKGVSLKFDFYFKFAILTYRKIFQDPVVLRDAGFCDFMALNSNHL